MQLMKAKTPSTNVGELERWLSLVGGSSLIAYGLVRRDLRGYGLAAIGGSLIFRGASGFCPMYQSLGMTTATGRGGRGTGLGASIPYELGIRVDKQVHVNRPPAELFQFWRNLENLPQFMDHLETVVVFDDRRSHWVAKAPAGKTVSWDAEIINEVDNQLIAWRSLEGADVDNGGSVRFEIPADGRGTVVKVALQYNPPAGALGALVARLFGEEPSKQIEDDLQRFKELMETGTVRTRSGQIRKEALGTEATWNRDQVNSSSEESFPASDPPSWTPERL